MKAGERRVALVPDAVAALVADGHEVLVEHDAGAGIDELDAAYVAAGARVVDASTAWTAALIVKVKELQSGEIAHLPPERAVFAFHHLAHEPVRTRALAARGATAIAFEALRDERGHFPLLAPMSVIAGRMSMDVAREHRGTTPARVVVFGAGHAGCAAAQAAKAAGATVTVLRRSNATPDAIERAVIDADLVVGAVFVPGEPTPKLLPRALVRRMPPGSMIVDISIEEGGIAETSRPTSHADPVYMEEGVIHYAVGNMPAVRPHEAARAISDAALPFVREMARKGIGAAMRDNEALRSGLLMWRGRVNHAGIAAESGLAYAPISLHDLA